MVTIGEKELSIKDVYSILFEEKDIQLSEQALQNVNDCYEFLIEFSKGKLIYGINTGFGPMAQYKIADKDLKQLQLNGDANSSDWEELFEKIKIQTKIKTVVFNENTFAALPYKFEGLFMNL